VIRRPPGDRRRAHRDRHGPRLIPSRHGGVELIHFVPVCLSFFEEIPQETGGRHFQNSQKITRPDVLRQMEHFRGRSAEVERTLRLCRKLAKGEDPEDVGFARELVTSYGRVARRVRDDTDMGLSRYPHEAAPGVSPFTGGYFAHPEWPVRRGLPRHASLRALAEHESNYVNATGYWLSFSEAALALRDEEIARDSEIGNQEAGRLDIVTVPDTRGCYSRGLSSCAHFCSP
jgi:hypothetical protein